MGDDRIEEVLDLLDAWRHLPHYQLERRADIFFAIYLRMVLEAELSVRLHLELIPELPIRRGLVYPAGRAPNKSFKVDYAAFEPEGSRVWLVELKTDMKSRSQAQDRYLSQARDLGFRKLADGIRTILLATSSRSKYLHLARALERWGFFELPPTLSQDPPALTKRSFRDVQVLRDAAIDVIYVQPHDATSDERVITFDVFADHVAKLSDSTSQRFARSLREWSRVRAGEARPRAWPQR